MKAKTVAMLCIFVTTLIHIGLIVAAFYAGERYFDSSFVSDKCSYATQMKIIAFAGGEAIVCALYLIAHAIYFYSRL